MGLEPMISRTTIWRANQLHHTHHTEPGGIRTLDLRLRRPLLYPAELQTRINFIPVYRLLTDYSVRKRVMGIEPTYPAWKAGVLPLNYTRMFFCFFVSLKTRIIISHGFIKCNPFFQIFLIFLIIYNISHF